MTSSAEANGSHLRPDGTTFPPVTPDPPYPPGYRAPVVPDTTDVVSDGAGEAGAGNDREPRAADKAGAEPPD